jgi:AcrR family transcriptional regulator
MRLLNFLGEKYLEKGYQNYRVADLASELNIIKKTFYKHFRNKEDLVREVLTKYLRDAYTTVVTIIQAKSNVVEKFLSLSKMVEIYFKIFNETSIARLKQYQPQLAVQINEFRSNRVIPLIKLLLKIGSRKKLIINIPPEIILQTFTAALGSIIDNKFIGTTDYSFRHTFKYAFYMLLNGILTKKGKQYLNHKIEETK